MTALLWPGICDILILVGLFLTGALTLRVILGRIDKLIILSLSFGLGCGFFTWLLFILSWAGIVLNRITVLSAFIVVLVVLVLLARIIPARPVEQNPKGAADGKISVWLTTGLWIIILISIAAVTVLAVGLSYFGWDDIARWAVKGYGIALQGTVLAGANWGGVGLSYPLNIPILISIFRILDGDVLPGSKLIYPVFYASLLIGCYRFLALQGLKKWAASLAVLLMTSTPILFTHAFMGYANLPFTFYFVSGLLMGLEGVQTGATRSTVLGGTLLSIAVLTRPEGLILFLVCIAALGGVRLLTASGRMKLLPLLLPAVVLTVPWYFFQWFHPTSDVEVYQYTSLAVKGLLAGDIRWSALYTIIRYIAGQIIRFEDWGYTIFLSSLLLFAGLRPYDLRHDFSKSALFFAIVGVTLVILWSAYIAAYAPEGSDFLYEWISTTLMRSFMPSGVCLTLLGFLSLKDLL